MNPINELFLTVLGQERSRWFGIAVRIIGRAEDAEDVLQICAVQLAQARLDHVPPAHVRFYLTQVVRNRALDFRKAQWRVHCRQEPFTEVHADTGADSGTTPLDELLTAEGVAQQETRRECVRQGLSCLSPEQQRAVRWMYFCVNPTTLATLADAEGISVWTARSRVQAGLRRLRGLLVPEVSQPPAT